MHCAVVGDGSLSLHRDSHDFSLMSAYSDLHTCDYMMRSCRVEAVPPEERVADAAVRSCLSNVVCLPHAQQLGHGPRAIVQSLARASSVHLLRGCVAAELKKQTQQSGLLMLLSGAALAMHFASWVEGIENTSITHALFFSSVTPIIIAGGMWAFGLPISSGTLPSEFHLAFATTALHPSSQCKAPPSMKCELYEPTVRFLPLVCDIHHHRWRVSFWNSNLLW